ncbi:hypothetical protein [Arthrobacter sp. zg-Y877]|uniref:hypothetical protein n=1 Tax=Arthrobacter sp. zg-Y877 TaxID=3049074 RepID=UPI0025A4AC8C|nr:hypothetical protein [Arthrobacter sp. zg-Y877]MDM7989182.1 hypothetical protein [Arthrobacter sp. zg-Y877]
MTRLEGPLADPQSGLWIAGRLAQAGTVSGTVPEGFEAYARIFHPIHAQLMGWQQDGPATVDSRTMRWQELAEVRGAVPHPLMQWASILAGYRNPVSNEPGWQYEDPLVGSMPSGTLAEVVRILGAHTAAPETCTAGLWDGYGWVSGSVQAAFIDAGGTAARLQLPLRGYLLFQADLSIFAGRGWQERNGWDPLQSPNLLWPADAAWFLATEIDLDTTLVGGPAALIADLVESRTIEALQVPADGDVTALGDTVNEAPD